MRESATCPEAPPPPLPSVPRETQKPKKSNLQPGKPFHIGRINRNSIFPETSPASVTGGLLTAGLLAAAVPSPLLPVTRNEGRPPQGARGCHQMLDSPSGEGALPLPGSDRLIGSCLNKLSPKW